MKKQCTCHPRGWIFLLGEILFGETGHTYDCELVIEKYNKMTNKPMNTQEIQEWEKEFEEKFDIPWGIDNSAGEYGLTFQGWDEIKSFISQKLKEQRSKIREELKLWRPWFYNKIITEADKKEFLNILSK
jgi:hypothetical protein